MCFLELLRVYSDCGRRAKFDSVEAVFELDGSFQCFGQDSRYFVHKQEGVTREFAHQMCQQYGNRLEPGHPLGFEDGQMLIGFHHNIPDNTLPIIWHNGSPGAPWRPMFRRYPKNIRLGKTMKDPLANPFNITKADDFSDQEINDLWVDITSGDGFSRLVKPTSPMPMYILGGKGSGKTHLMKYFSYPLQKIRHAKDVVAGVCKDGYLGFYLRCGGLNASRF